MAFPWQEVTAGSSLPIYSVSKVDGSHSGRATHSKTIIFEGSHAFVYLLKKNIHYHYF